MRLFPTHPYTFNTGLGQDELEEQMVKNLKKSVNLVSSYSRKPFTGYKEGGNSAFYKIVSSSPGLGAISVCEIKLTPTNNSISATFRINNGFKALFLIWLIGATIGLGISTASLDDWFAKIIMVVFILPISAFLFLKMIGLFERVSRELLIRKLEKHLQLKSTLKK